MSLHFYNLFSSGLFILFVFFRCETDLDSLNTTDRLTRMEDPSAMYFGGSQHHQPQQQEQQQHYQYGQYEDNTLPVDISEADERMKRYYGIVPKQPAPPISAASAADKAEIRTVRIVKRESEKRQRDKSKSRYDDNSFGMDELTEEDQAHGNSNGLYSEDPIMDDPVLSQFSHVLTLPRRGSKRDEQGKRPLSQRNSIALNETPTDGRPLSLGPDQWRGSLRPRRNMSSVSCCLFNVLFSLGHAKFASATLRLQPKKGEFSGATRSMSHCTVPFCSLFVLWSVDFCCLTVRRCLSLFYYRYPFICFLGVSPSSPRSRVVYSCHLEIEIRPSVWTWTRESRRKEDWGAWIRLSARPSSRPSILAMPHVKSSKKCADRT